MEQKSNGKEIMAVRFSSLGDVVMSIPVLYSACYSNPNKRFTFVTKQVYSSLLINRPANLTVVGADLKGVHKGFAGMYRLAKELGKPYAFLDMHNVLRTRVLSFFMRLKGVPVVSLDKGRKYRKALVKNGAETQSPLKSTFERYSELFRIENLHLDKRFAGLYATQPAEVSLFAEVSAPKGENERWVGVAPFAAHAGKIFPLERMRKIVDTLAAKENVKIFLFGGGAIETQTLSEWAYDHDNVVCVAGKKLGFSGELSLMHYLDVMLCMDSGNMHMAAIAGTKTLSIWGATHPSAGFTAWRSTLEDRIDVVLSCRPCSIFGDKECRYGTHACMTGIKSSDILDRLNKYLTNN
jgi:ADP-heptose:LPS heptosyltransferase